MNNNEKAMLGVVLAFSVPSMAYAQGLDMTKNRMGDTPCRRPIRGRRQGWPKLSCSPAPRCPQ
jgi:hypothetical protein